MRLSFALVPSSVSRPFVPILLIAEATPLAAANATAVAANRRTILRILRSFPRSGHPSRQYKQQVQHRPRALGAYRPNGLFIEMFVSNALRRTPSERSSQNNPSTHSGE